MKEKSTNKILGNPYVGFIIFGIVISLLIPLINGGVLKTSWLGIMGGTVIYTVAALGLNLLLGWSGLVSLGTAGFMGLGAYVSAYVTMDMGAPWIVGIIAALVVCTLFGILVGLASLKIEGLYLGIMTLCVAEILKKTFEELDNFTNGFQGKQANFPSLFGHTFNQKGAYIVLVVILVIMMILTYNLTKGQLGRAMNAMRGSQVAAQAMGISLLKYRLIAFSLATAFAGLSGAMYVHFIKFSYPTTWGITLSLVILAIIVIGGLRSIYGTFLGAFIVYAVPDLFLKKLPVIGEINGLAYVFSGVLIILVILFYPGGAINVFKLFTRKKKAKVVEGPVAEEKKEEE